MTRCCIFLYLLIGALRYTDSAEQLDMPVEPPKCLTTEFSQRNIRFGNLDRQMDTGGLFISLTITRKSLQYILSNIVTPSSVELPITYQLSTFYRHIVFIIGTFLGRTITSINRQPHKNLSISSHFLTILASLFRLIMLTGVADMRIMAYDMLDHGLFLHALIV